jgi:hypothetical protein
LSRLKFKHLSESDLERFTQIYEDKSIGYSDRIRLLSRGFGIDKRTVLRWWAKIPTLKNRVISDKFSPPKEEQAKVLLFDIETSPLKAYVWGLWNQDIHHKNGQLDADWFMLSWSAKWLFGERIISDRLTSKEVLKEDDERITKSLWELLNEADILVGHNVERFDIKKSNTRFLKHGLPPVSYYRTIDTLKQCKKNFSITSNRLDYIGRFLGIGQKVETGGFDLWKRCLEGEDEALEQMRIYCDGDVQLLEDVYLRIRNFIRPHPNLGLYIADNVERCPTCASEDIKWEGAYSTSVNMYNAFRCNSCGAIGRSRESKLDIIKRKSLLVPTSR